MLIHEEPILGVPSRSILLIPRHSPRCPNHLNASSLRTAQEPSFSFHKALSGVFPLAPSSRFCIVLGTVIIRGLSARKIDTPVLRIALAALERTLNAGNEIEVTIECGFCC